MSFIKLLAETERRAVYDRSVAEGTTRSPNRKTYALQPDTEIKRGKKVNHGQICKAASSSEDFRLLRFSSSCGLPASIKAWSGRAGQFSHARKDLRTL
jgi:hypothetical protein